MQNLITTTNLETQSLRNPQPPQHQLQRGVLRPKVALQPSQLRDQFLLHPLQQLPCGLQRAALLHLPHDVLLHLHRHRAGLLVLEHAHDLGARARALQREDDGQRDLALVEVLGEALLLGVGVGDEVLVVVADLEEEA